MENLEERMKIFLKDIYLPKEEEDDTAAGGGGDTFAGRAEWFFSKRPHLLALLKDLYNGYITLKDHCSHHHNHRQQPQSSLTTMFAHQQDQIDTWDVQSSLSYHHSTDDDDPRILYPTASSSQIISGFDEIVSHLVMKNVEENLLKQLVGEMEQQCHDSSRKIDILKKLIEVLESERIVLLNENARSGYKVAELMDENQRISSEAMFFKRKAAQLASLVLKLREDHRIFLLSSKIEDLQRQIYGLKKRNKDYNQQLLMMKENPESDQEKTIMKNNNPLMRCFQSEKIKFKKTNEAVSNGDEENRGRRKWWEKFALHGFSSSSSSSSSTT